MGAHTLVLWDVDHTLMETRGVGAELFRSAFSQATDRELVYPAEVTGRTEPAIFRETVELHHIPYNAALFDRYAILLAAGYEAHAAELARRGRALPGAHAAITALGQADGIVQSVLTGNLRPVAETKLKTFGLDAGLDLDLGAYGSDHDKRACLVPIARRRAANKHGAHFDGQDTVLIGDSPSDVQAGLDSGTRVIAVATGRNSAAELRQAGAPLVLANLQDTRAVVEAVLRGPDHT
jgi:phosphoglycolate phosphatase-like HAD superfamily hydrolase